MVEAETQIRLYQLEQITQILQAKTITLFGTLEYELEMKMEVENFLLIQEALLQPHSALHRLASHHSVSHHSVLPRLVSHHSVSPQENQLEQIH